MNSEATPMHRWQGTSAAEAWPMRNPVLYTLLWVAIILAVFAPLAVRLYNRASTK